MYGEAGEAAPRLFVGGEYLVSEPTSGRRAKACEIVSRGDAEGRGECEQGASPQPDCPRVRCGVFERAFVCVDIKQKFKQ